MPGADKRALAWARKIARDTETGAELEWLDSLESFIVPVRCRACGQMFTALEPSGNRAAVLPVDDDHLGTIFRPDSPKDSNGYGVTTYEKVGIHCPCKLLDGSPKVGARKLAREWLYALMGGRAITWPLSG